MFNDSIIRAYNRTRKREYLLKEELLHLNKEGLSHDDIRRMEIIERSLSNLKNQTIIVNKLKKHSLSGFIDYWEMLGFFDHEEETKIDLEEVIFLSKSWLKNFSAVIDLAFMLTQKNSVLKDTLYIDENEFMLHQLRNPEYYSNKDRLTIDSIVKTSCFQQVNLFSTSEKKGTFKIKKEVELLSIQIELRYMLKKIKLNIPNEKQKLFSDILYNLALKSQYEAIEKTNNIVAMTELDYNLILNLSRSLNRTLDYLKEYKLLLKIIIMEELKR